MNDFSPPAHFEENAPPPVDRSGPPNPFGSAGPAYEAESLNAGTVEIESRRATAEVQARMVVAKRFPRDESVAWGRLMAACNRKGFAERALYSYKRGGGSVGGPSIRLAEEMARHWGNIEYGIRELSRTAGKSEMQAFAWDLETNVISSQNFTVNHKRDKKGGAVDLTDERDIYEVTANMGARRLRARILAILPPDFAEDATEACRKTCIGEAGKNMKDKLKNLVSAMQKIYVSPEMLRDYLGHPIDACTPEELVELSGIYRAITEKSAGVSDYFSGKNRVANAPADPASPFSQNKPAQDGQKPEPIKTAQGVIEALDSCKTRPELERLDTVATGLITAAEVGERMAEADAINAALEAATKRVMNAK